MAENYILAMDVGTSALKAAILDRHLNVIDQTQGQYAYTVVENMGVEIDPETIWAAVMQVTNHFSAYADQIAFLAFCTFCPAMTLMDRDGNVLRPSIIHLDRRTYPQARRALKQVGEQAFLDIAGNLPFPGGVSLASLVWIQEHEPEIYAAAAMCGHMNTFLMKRFVNRWLIDPTNASMTGLYETVAYGGWNADMMREFHVLPEKLPEIADCDTVVGGLSRSAAAALHLKTGIPVIMGGGDTACAVYGAGCEQEGDMLNIAGSSEILAITTNHPYPNKHYNMRTHVLRDRWVIFTITVGGIALEWFRSQFCQDMDKAAFYDDYLPEVLKTQADRATEVFHPHLSGNRFSMTQQRGVFSGLTLLTTREDMIRALAKGVMQPMEITLAECRKHLSLNTSIFLTGGGANEALKQYKERTVFSGYSFTLRQECSLVGVAKLAAKYLN